jgi:hypothetical protein
VNAQTTTTPAASTATNSAAAPTSGTGAAVNAPPAAAAKHDFAKLAAGGAAGAARVTDAALLQEANAALPTLDAWTPTALRRFTKEQPLFVTPLQQSKLQSSTIYSDAESRIWFVVGGARKSTRWSDLAVEDRGAILAALVRYTPGTPAEVMRAAEAFALVHGLPEMAEMLLRARSGK